MAYSILQSISFWPDKRSISLVLEKCLQPENAPPANGDGCAAFSIKCFEAPISFSLL